MVYYEKIELIKPERRFEMKKDLEERTGLSINRIEIGKIDFLRDTARVNIYYFEDERYENLADRAISACCHRHRHGGLSQPEHHLRRRRWSRLMADDHELRDETLAARDRHAGRGSVTELCVGASRTGDDQSL